MKLNKIEILNFRCFGLLQAELVPDVTIIIGKNGSGKSTLINAIKYGLSFIFSKNKNIKQNGQSISASAKGLDIISYSTMDAGYNMARHDFCYPVSIKCNAVDADMTSLSWELFKENADATVSHVNYENAYKRFQNRKDYPVIAIYSDSFPHVESKLTKYAQDILSSENPIPMNFGYYQWGTDTACTEVWERRFINVWKEILNKNYSFYSHSFYLKNKDIFNSTFEQFGLKEKNSVENSPDYKSKMKDLFINQLPLKRLMWEIISLEREKNTIINYLKQFSKPVFDRAGNDDFMIEDISVTTRDKKDYISFRFQNGESILFNNLPSGYRRLFSIVLDIAYRAYLLQLRGDGFPILKKNPEDVTGIVVIDEIDLHLHPSLQQEVIQRFRQTFPKIQLIASTHSALIMSNIKQNEMNRVYKLTKMNDTDYTISPVQLYGMDVSTITEFALETIPRAKEIDNRLNTLFSLIDDENYKEANIELLKLKSEFGDNLPELSKAQTMLDFFEDD